MLPIEKILRGEEIAVSICLTLPDNHKTTGIPNGPGFQQDRVNYAEHRGIGPDPDASVTTPAMVKRGDFTNDRIPKRISYRKFCISDTSYMMRRSRTFLVRTFVRKSLADAI